ncbi:carboxy methyl transferase for protein phosphatase 2A [Sporothrix bragantina]|uniref:Carboxy methyl transferase for protein phosphatase 2A n=1 Tax=Sporothrix bragantina TaxID=671064 RepID=A0ABP0C237_9PEZI
MASPGQPGPPSSYGAASSPSPAPASISTPPAPLPMAAPSIPNLLGRLGNGPPRAGRGGRRGLGRGNGLGGGLHAGNQAQLRGGGMPRRLDHNGIVQSTDTDAAISRMSAVDIGLLDDPFAQYFAGDGGGPVPRRLPIINRVLARKRNIVQSVPAIRSLLTGPTTEHTSVGGDDPPKTDSSTGPRSWQAELGSGNQFWAHGLDLRELAAGAGGGLATLPGLRTDVPTLLVSECCLCYLQPSEAAAVLRWFGDRVNAPSASLGVVIYEPIRPFDAFGRTMVANLAGRGIEMPTLVAYPDGAAQEVRLQQEAGLTRAKHQTIDQIWRAWVTDDEQERVNRLDGLDEVEEWELLASHYVVAWGSRGAHFDAAWAQLYGQ